MTIQSNVRVQLLGVDDADVLSDDYVDLILADAKTITKISDESSIALRYYTCYLIATNWESIGAVRRREGVEYAPPNPQKYLDMYDSALVCDLSNNEDVIAVKESTNQDNIIGSNGVMEKGDYPDSSN